MDQYSSSKRSRDEFESDTNRFDELDTKKQHIDPAAELISNVCKDIRRIGENSNLVSQVDDISYISNPVVAEFEKIDKLRTSILNTLYAIVIQQPQKISALSALILICNAKNFLVSKYVVEFFNSKAQEMLDSIEKSEKETEETEKDEKPSVNEDAGVFNNIKSVLKFIASLLPIVEIESIINVFEQFINLAIELQDKADARCGIAEEIFYNSLMAIPYLLSNNFSQDMIDKCNDLLALAEKFQIYEGEKEMSALYPFDVKLLNFTNNLPYDPKKMVNLVFPALKTLQGENKDWKDLGDKLFLDFKVLIDPIIESSLKDNTISSEVIRHKFSQLSLPSIELLLKYEPNGAIDVLWYKHPRLLFQVYNTTTAFETVPPITTYFGLIFKDLAFDILTNLSFNKNETAIQLSILDLYFAKNLFAPPGSSVDQLGLINKDNESGENDPPLSTWKIEDVAVESILAMIFQLPRPSNREIYYYTVLISCCKESPESIAPVFGRAIRYFYNNLITMDLELRNRFMDWMSIQISNFDFSWKWDEWVQDSKRLRNLTYHPKKLFIKNLIAKEIRLSNKNRIKESFVGINQDPESQDEVVLLDEFYQYLNISLFPNESRFIIDYDLELYGNNESTKEVLAKLVFERKERLASKISASYQEEIAYNFSNSSLPLHEMASEVYDFITANWKSNSDFFDLYKKLGEKLNEIPEINSEKFKINLFFQTYAYIGSRSIYSVVSLLSRDLLKLKFISGCNLEEEEQKEGEFRFPKEELSEETLDNRQKCIIESIFRIWVHHPQVIFLILEYLIEFEVLKPEFLIRKAMLYETNLLIQNVSCLESIERILVKYLESSPETLKNLLMLLVTCIVENLNHVVTDLGLDDSADVKAITDFEDESIDDNEFMLNVDRGWLFYEYYGFLRSILRRFAIYPIDVTLDIKQLVEKITNKAARESIIQIIDQLHF